MDYFIAWCMLVIVLFVLLFPIIAAVINAINYKPGRNPYHRICRKCGQHQIMYQSCFGSWWEEVYPLGNNPECRCHKDTERRDI